jgi:hypothetical protein
MTHPIQNAYAFHPAYQIRASRPRRFEGRSADRVVRATLAHPAAMAVSLATKYMERR